MIHSKELLHYTKELSLLFAEDHTELRENTTEILNNFFHHVDAVSEGKEALELYQKNQYDIVLSDIRMPLMDGIELTKKIYELNPAQKIIILSAHDESKYLIPLINMSVAKFIKKPIDYQELLDALLKVSKSIINKEEPENIQNNLTLIALNANFSYDRENKLLMNSRENVYLTKYEIIFLDLLTGQVGKIFSNEEIVNYYLQQNENIDAQNIRKLVSKLRKKVPQDSIESVYGVGYRVVSAS
ncbi:MULTISPECIES: response regulator transcription factor [Sulfurimonas]|uniref:response regulator transcription factor n=1 Tax=Sulfurimonas TaxID=202746 RepID=UPI001265163C|nr:response regulator transcription factor [Sulfurimonas indica]